MNASTPADPGPVPADLELYRLCVKDLRSLCSRLKLTTTGGRDALIKRIAEARTNTDKLRGTPPPTQDGGEHVENENDQNALELQFQQLQPGVTGQGVATRRAFISLPAHPSTIDCSRVTKRGDRESGISRRSSRS